LKIGTIILLQVQAAVMRFVCWLLVCDENKKIETDNPIKNKLHNNQDINVTKHILPHHNQAYNLHHYSKEHHLLSSLRITHNFKK
jgi:uncharacterized protein (DUF305 family)